MTTPAPLESETGVVNCGPGSRVQDTAPGRQTLDVDRLEIRSVTVSEVSQ